MAQGVKIRQLRGQYQPEGIVRLRLTRSCSKQTFRYFWDFAHPVSGSQEEATQMLPMAHETVTVGGTGFTGICPVIVATERGWIQSRYRCQVLNA